MLRTLRRGGLVADPEMRDDLTAASRTVASSTSSRPDIDEM
ncbi:hypothetical protein ACU4GR_13975 [Methylobacterium oryzae CBMB20]